MRPFVDGIKQALADANCKETATIGVCASSLPYVYRIRVEYRGVAVELFANNGRLQHHSVGQKLGELMAPLFRECSGEASAKQSGWTEMV